MRTEFLSLLAVERAPGSPTVESVMARSDSPGVRVRTAKRFAKALEAIEQDAFDLVVLHVGAPEPERSTADDPLDQVRALVERSGGAAVALLLENDSPDVARDAIALGAEDVFVRPYVTPSGLASAFRNAVWRRASRERSTQAEPCDAPAYASIVENLSEGIVVTAPDGEALFANPAALSLLGRTREQLLGRPIRFPIRSGEQTEVELGLAEGPRYAEVGLTDTIWHGRPARLATLRDATRRRKAEEEWTRLSTAMEQTSELIVVTDTQGRILYANPAFERVTGYSRTDLRNHTPAILKSGRQSDEFYHDLWGTITEGNVWRGRLVNRARSGDLFEEEASISPVRNTSGQIVSFVQVARDITRQVSLEAQLRQSQKMEAIGRLAGGVAHDFNNLLTAIMGNVGLLELELDDTHPAYPCVCEIADAGARAAELTGQLLMFSRKGVSRPEVFDLGDVVAGMDRLLQRIIGEDVQLRANSSGEPCTVQADRGQIEQIILNLAVNGRDAMPTGGKLTIEVSRVSLDHRYCSEHAGLKPGEYGMVAVSDTGTGMDEATRARLFEPFFTTKGERGTGLGLATVYGIVSQHGGAILCYSELGYGTTFKVYLPLAAKGAEPAPRKQKQQEKRGGGERVLVVDDESTVLDVCARMLGSSGYVVHTARTGAEALEAFADLGGDIDLLLVDVILPDMGGRDVARALLEKDPDLLVLFASGYTEDAIHRHGVLEEGTAFIAKPYSMKDLLATVRDVLDGAFAR